MKNKAGDFWSRVSIADDNSCWDFVGFVGIYGYGIFYHNKKQARAHRIAFLLHNGYLPEAVCHTCDNRKCCNPKHLFAGSKGDNNRDRHAKGRSAGSPGEAHHNHKLTESDVVEIRRMLMSGMKNRDIAASFNVTEFTISDVKRRKSWKHV
jgi:hypothetical protein